MNILYEVKVEKDKNRLFLQLKGFLKDDELAEAARKVKEGVDQLQQNFDVINDISEFSPATPKGREIIMDAQVYVLKNKVGRVVRVVGNVIGQMQFDRTSKQAGYTAISVRSLQEAYDVLDGKIKIDN